MLSLRIFISHEIKLLPVQADPKISSASMDLKKIFNKIGSNTALILIRDLLLTLGNQNSTLYLHQFSKFEITPICPTQGYSFC